MSITSDAEPRGRPFNEQAALEELERLQRAIEDTRRRRKETGAAFDAFVRSFQKERQEAAAQVPRALARDDAAPALAAVSPPAGTETAPPALVPAAAAATTVVPAIVDDAGAPVVVQPAPIPAPIAASPVASRRKPFPIIPLIAGAAMAIVAALVLIGRPWGTPVPGSGVRDPGAVGSLAAANSGAASAVRREPRTPDPASRTPDLAAAPPPASAPPGVNGELTAVRRVWVRIITDGNRVERELPAGTVVPLHAQRTLTLRIGDAGAVKVIVDNRDQGPLGRDGEVVMRTFTVQTPAR